MNAFEKELALLQDRIADLAARVGALAAPQHATPTETTGIATVAQAPTATGADGEAWQTIPEPWLPSPEDAARLRQIRNSIR